MSDLSLGRLLFSMSADVAQLQRDMQSAKGIVASATKEMRDNIETVKRGFELLAVGLGVEKFAEFVHKAIEGAAALEELSQRSGIAVENLSQLQYAAKIASVSSDTLTTAVKKLEVSMANAAAGDQLKIALFKQLGITQADLGKGTESVMMKMADAYAHAQDGAGKTAVSIGLMGKAGDEMIPFLNRGADAIRDLMREADALGLTISAEFAQKAKEFEENLTRIQAAGQKTAIYLGGEFVTSLNKAMQAFIDNAKEGSKFLGVLEAYRTFFTGDDLHKANVKLTEDTEKLLKAQADLDRLKRQGYSQDSIAVTQKSEQIAQLQSEVNTTLNYRRQLEGEADAKNAASEAARKAREEGKQLEAQSKASMAAAQKEAEEYRNIKKAIDERVAVQQAEIDAGRTLTDFEKFEIKIHAEITNAKVALTAAHKAQIETQLQGAKVTDLENQVLRSQIALAKQLGDERANQKNTDYAQSAQALRDIEAAWAAQLKTVKDAIKAQEDEADAERLVIQLGVSHAEAVQMVTIARLQDAQTRTVVDGEAYNALQQQIDGRNELLGLLHDKSGWDTQLQAIQRVRDLGHQLWSDLFSGGHDVLKRLGDDIKRYLIEELFQLVAKQWIFNISANVAGGVANAVGGAAGSSLFGSAAGAGSGIAGFGSAIAGGFSGSGAAGFAASGGSFASTVGGGLATDAMGATVIEGAAAAGIETGVFGAVSAGLAAVPVAGWIALGALVLSKAFGKGGGPKVEGGFGAGVTQFGDTSTAKQAGDLIAGQYKTIADALGLVNDKLAVGFQFGKDPQGTAKTQLQITGGSYNRASMYGGEYENVGRSDADFQQAVELATAQLIIKNLQEQVSGPVGDFLKSINITTASLSDMKRALEVATDVGALDKALDALGPKFAYIKNLSIDNQEALVQQAGGVANLQAAFSSYYSSFLTEGEKHDLLLQQITSTFSQAGLQLPATHQAYDDLLHAQDLTTDAGRANAVMLLQNAAAFNQLFPALQDTAQAVDDTRKALQDTFDQWKQAQSDLESAKGALRDYGQSLRDNVSSIEQSINELRGQALQNLAAATDAARAALQTVQQANATAQAALVNAQNALRTALQGVASQVQAAADRVAAAQARVKSAQDAITQGYMDAQSQLQQAQQGYTQLLQQQAQALRDAGKSIKEALFAINSTSGPAGQRAGVTLARFYDLAGKAPHDAEAAGQLGAIAQEAIRAVENSAHSRAEADAQERAIREKLAEVISAIDKGTEGKTATDPLVAAQQRIADATAEVAKWSQAIAESGASMTHSTDAAAAALEAFHQASDELGAAQSSQVKLLAAIKDLDLSGVSASTEVWQATVDAAKQAQQNLTDAQNTATSAAGDLETALQLAADAGLEFDAVATDPLDKFRTALTDMVDAQTAAADVQASLYTAADTLVEKYQSQTTALDDANAALTKFNTAVADIDLTDTFDKLKSLLDNYSTADNASNAAYNSIASTQSGGEVVSAYQQLLHRAPEMGGLVYWLDYLAQGHSDAELRAGIMASPEFQALATPHASGLWRVPRDGYPAVLHRDEAVLTAMQAQQWRTSVSFPGMKAGGVYTNPGGPSGSFDDNSYAYTPPASGGASGSVSTLVNAMNRRIDSQQEESRRIYAEMIYRVQNLDLRTKTWTDAGLYTRTTP
jgi:DNA repair exonuclease SbcCD ATPase subunit